MIKCSVTINGTISRAAQMRTDKDNNSFVSFPVSVVLPAKSGINKTVEVSVSMSGTQTDCPKFQPNQRVEMQGMLTLRKKGDALYFNFMAGSVNLQPSETKDKIEGEMEFRGALGGKGIVLKNDKATPSSCSPASPPRRLARTSSLYGCVSFASQATRKHFSSPRQRSTSKVLPSFACTTTRLTSAAGCLKSRNG